MLKIAICDDEANELEQTHASIKKYCKARTEFDISAQKFQCCSDLLDSYSLSAKDYILKPYTEDSLFSALDKAVDSMSAEKARRYLLHVPGGVYAIPYGRLLYMEYYKHRLIAYTIDGEKVESIVLRKPFTNLISPLIEEGRFVQVSASYIINMQYVRRFTSRCFELSNGCTVPLSRTYANARSTYLDYIFEKET